MSILLKQSVTTLLPGAPGTPGTPGTPGVPPTPPSPPVCYDIIVGHVPVYSAYVWYDSLGIAHTATIIVGYHDIINHECYGGSLGSPGTPGVPGTPAVPGLPDTAVVDLQVGWNAGGTTLNSFDGDGAYRFSVPRASAGVVTGFNQNNTGEGYHEITHGFYIASGSFAVMESGVVKTAYTTYASDAEFVVRRLGGLVEYFIGVSFVYTKVYTSTVPSSGPIFGDASLYIAGDRINNAFFSDYIDPAWGAVTGTAYGVLGTITGSGGTVTGGATGVFSGAVGDGGNPVQGTASGVLGAITGEAYEGTLYATSTGVLAGLRGYSGGGMVEPQFSITHGVLQSLQGFAAAIVGNAGGATGILTQPVGFSTNTEYAYSSGVLTPITGFSFDATADVAPNYARIALSGYSLFALGRTTEIAGGPGVHAVLSGYALRGYGGANLHGKTLPVMTLSAAGTLTVTGAARLTAPAATLSASGTAAMLGAGSAELRSKYLTYAFGGATGTRRLSGYSFAATGITGATSTARLELSGYTLVASGSTGIVGSAHIVGPALRRVAAGMLRATLSRPTLQATGHVVISAEYEGYSITLMPSQDGVTTATTRYTNYPFNYILRWGTAYYGVGNDGIFELTGDLYDGEPIIAVAQTAESDHGQAERKHAVALYASGRAGADMDVTVISNEIDENIYQYSPLNKLGARNYRAKFGKGIVARYWAYKLTNIDGEDFALDDLTPEVAVSRRVL